MKILRYTLLLILFPVNVFSQDTFSQDVMDTEEMLNGLFSAIRQDSDLVARDNANKAIEKFVDAYAVRDDLWKSSLGVRNLGQVMSPDSLLKIITWNLNTGKGQGRYYCYFIKKNDGMNGVSKLIGNYNEGPVKTDTVYTGEYWYGALYYDIRPFSARGLKYYILLGLDLGNPLISRKIIDVLSFGQNGTPWFGQKIFAMQEDSREYREVFEYSSAAMMTLRFTSDTSIVFDHLVPFSPELKDDRRYYGPDYSYDAFILRNGIWHFSLNLDIRNRE